MPQAKIAWERIREPHLYGERGRIGTRMVEVVRAYTGEWCVFQYVDGIQRVIGDPDCLPAPNRYSYNGAKQIAARWLAEQEQEQETRVFTLGG